MVASRPRVPTRPVSSAMAEKIKSEMATGTRKWASHPKSTTESAAIGDGKYGLNDLIGIPRWVFPRIEPSLNTNVDDVDKEISNRHSDHLKYKCAN